MKKSTLILLISTAIFFTSTLVLLYLNYLKPTTTFIPTTGTISTDAPIPTTNPTADPTASWKTYKNEEYGFEMRYPANYSVAYEDLRKIDKNYLATIHSSDYIVDDKEMVTTSGTSFYYIEGITKSCSEIEKQLTSKTGFRLVNKTDSITIFELDDRLTSYFPSRQALISNKNSCIQIYCNSSTSGCTNNAIGQEFAQILSTFKFISSDYLLEDGSTYGVIDNPLSWNSCGAEDNEISLNIKQKIPALAQVSQKEINGLEIIKTSTLGFTQADINRFYLCQAGAFSPLKVFTDKILWISSCGTGADWDGAEKCEETRSSIENLYRK